MTGTLAAFTASIGTTITSVFGWVSDIFDGILANPILLFMISIPFVGLAVSMAFKIFKKAKKH